jgi:hypothetical protein
VYEVLIYLPVSSFKGFLPILDTLLDRLDSFQAYLSIKGTYSIVEGN